MKTLKSTIILLALSAMLFSACKKEEVKTKSIVETVVDTDNFSILEAALKKAGLAGALSGSGPFTVFAPTNAAFEAFLTEQDIAGEGIEYIDSAALAPILLFHVVSGKVLAANLTNGQVVTTLKTAPNNTFTVGLTGGAKITDGASRVSNITQTDIQASNGVIHVIDKVMLPAPSE
jgi:uncharacterized surface protein with fasciclin (FAS1) repeats